MSTSTPSSSSSSHLPHQTPQVIQPSSIASGSGVVIDSLVPVNDDDDVISQQIPPHHHDHNNEQAIISPVKQEEVYDETGGATISKEFSSPSYLDLSAPESGFESGFETEGSEWFEPDDASTLV